jgi:hypothetical protein
VTLELVADAYDGDLAGLLDRTRDYFHRFIVVDSPVAELVALWVAHTYGGVGMPTHEHRVLPPRRRFSRVGVRRRPPPFVLYEGSSNQTTDGRHAVDENDRREIKIDDSAPLTRSLTTDAAILAGPTIAVVANHLLNRPKQPEPPKVEVPPGHGGTAT